MERLPPGAPGGSVGRLLLVSLLVVSRPAIAVMAFIRALVLSVLQCKRRDAAACAAVRSRGRSRVRGGTAQTKRQTVEYAEGMVG